MVRGRWRCRLAAEVLADPEMGEIFLGGGSRPPDSQRPENVPLPDDSQLPNGSEVSS